MVKKQCIPIAPGIFNINKPEGWTSFDVVNKLKKTSKLKKIGHAGTLDPLATGVLVVAVGREYTRTLPTMMQMSKEYIAEILFGVETDTYDLDGRIEFCRRPEMVNKQNLTDTLKQFQGEIMQVPPRFSAVRKNGRKLYEYARKNQEVEIDPRPVTIHHIELLDFQNGPFPVAIIKTCVSKGTYVRTLAYDMGKALNTGAVLSKLVRTAVGKYHIKDSCNIEQFQASTD